MDEWPDLDEDDEDDEDAYDHDLDDEECYDDGESEYHQHCFSCGGCQCPGYCDDYQTYNLRPSETGNPVDTREVTADG